jgi:lipopolysaccharide export system permease protein
MRLIDRYLLSRFFRTLAICFVSAAGLFVVIDVFAKLEEFIILGERHGGLGRVLLSYYGARVVWIFDRMAPYLVLLAAIFTITWLHRSNELTALFAAGVSPRRIAKPVIAAALVVAGLSAVNREWAIPACREQLARSAKDWLGVQSQPLYPRYDNRTGIFFNGQSVFPGEYRVVQPKFAFETPMGEFGRHLAATSAFYRRASQDHPRGYLFDEVTEPKGIAELPSLKINDRLTVLTPQDFPWLAKNQCFLVSDVDFEQLTGGAGWRQFSSTGQLVRGLRNPSLDFGADVRVEIHARLVRPFLDMTLLFLGLPLAFSADHRNLFLAAGKGALLAAAFIVVVLACQGMGASYWIRPALAAWAPLLIFAPLAVYLNEPLRR